MEAMARLRQIWYELYHLNRDNPIGMEERERELANEMEKLDPDGIMMLDEIRERSEPIV